MHLECECRLVGLPTKIPFKLFSELYLPEKWWKKLSHWYLQIKCKLILSQKRTNTTQSSFNWWCYMFNATFKRLSLFPIKILLSRETAFPPLKEEWTPPGVRCMTSCCTSSKSLTMTESRQDRLEDQVRARDTLTGWWTCPGGAGLSIITYTSFMAALSVI